MFRFYTSEDSNQMLRYHRRDETPLALLVTDSLVRMNQRRLNSVGKCCCNHTFTRPRENEGWKDVYNDCHVQGLFLRHSAQLPVPEGIDRHRQYTTPKYNNNMDSRNHHLSYIYPCCGTKPLTESLKLIIDIKFR